MKCVTFEVHPSPLQNSESISFLEPVSRSCYYDKVRPETFVSSNSLCPNWGPPTLSFNGLRRFSPRELSGPYLKLTGDPTHCRG